jgi:lipopolysaccharide transport system permease protein
VVIIYTTPWQKSTRSAAPGGLVFLLQPCVFQKVWPKVTSGDKEKQLCTRDVGFTSRVSKNRPSRSAQCQHNASDWIVIAQREFLVRMMVNLSLIWELTRRDFSERFAGSVLGSLWAFIGPLVNLFIFIVIFGKIMGAKLPGNSSVYAFGIYLTAGLIPWTAFSSSILRCTSVFLDKKHIISKMRVSLPSLLIYVNLSESITFLISMGFFFIVLYFNGFHFSMRLLVLPFIYYLQMLFVFGAGLFAATLTVFLRDFKEIINVILQFWFWFTPIVYVRDILPDIVKRIVYFNPAYIIVESYQRIFVFSDDPPYKSLIVLCVLTHIMIFISYFIFRSLEKDVRDTL